MLKDNNFCRLFFKEPALEQRVFYIEANVTITITADPEQLKIRRIVFKTGLVESQETLSTA